MITFTLPNCHYCQRYKDCHLKENFSKEFSDEIFKRFDNFELPFGITMNFDCFNFCINPDALKVTIKKDGTFEAGGYQD